jgi:site-specific recombinase XerD
MRKRKAKPNYRRIVLRLPDLDHSKMAVLNSLTSPGSRRVYQFAINQFITWYCSEPRLAFNRIVVVRYRMYLESRRLAANTINQQLAAVRRLAHEAADAGLLSPDLAAGISRVKGVKQLGQRSGNWLSLEQSSAVLSHARGELMREKRDYAMLALLFGCGLRRSELVGLEMSDVQKRQEHWAIVDLIGKGGHIRTVPIPEWAKRALDEWTVGALHGAPGYEVELVIFEGETHISVVPAAVSRALGFALNAVIAALACDRLRLCYSTHGKGIISWQPDPHDGDIGKMSRWAPAN